MRNCW